MNSRLDNTQDNAFITELQQMQSDLAELKSRQSIGRALVTRSYPISTTDAFDFSAVAVPANSLKSFFFTATGDGTQTRPFGIQYSQVYNNGTDSAHRLSDYRASDATGTSYNWQNNMPNSTLNITGWIINVQTGNTPASIYIKFRGLLSCPGIRITYYAV